MILQEGNRNYPTENRRAMKLLSRYRQAEQKNGDMIRDMAEENPGAKILDCGCSDGEFTTELADKIGSRAVYGIEFVDELAKRAEEKGITVYRSDLDKDFSIESDTFDVVIANQIIEHLYNSDRFIKEIYRVLKKGGYAVVSTPNLASVHNLIALLFGKQPFPAHISTEVILGNSFDPKHGMKHGSKGENHVRIFTYEALKELFEYYGFRVEKMVGVGYYPFPDVIGRILARVDKRHAVYLTMKVRK